MEIADFYGCPGFSQFHLTNTTRGFAKLGGMHSSKKNDFQVAAAQAHDESIFESELSILRDVFRLLPSGVTVQDERGEFVLMNDAATAQLEAAASAQSAMSPDDRRDTCLELLRNGRPAVLEEAVTRGAT